MNLTPGAHPINSRGRRAEMLEGSGDASDELLILDCQVRVRDGRTFLFLEDISWRMRVAGRVRTGEYYRGNREVDRVFQAYPSSSTCARTRSSGYHACLPGKLFRDYVFLISLSPRNNGTRCSRPRSS